MALLYTGTPAGGPGPDDTALPQGLLLLPSGQRANSREQSSRTLAPSQQTRTARDHGTDVFGGGKDLPSAQFLAQLQVIFVSKLS